MDERLGKFLSRDCQSLFLSHELNAFLTSAWTAKCSGCRSRYERMVCTIISAPLCMPMPNWLGRKKVLRRPLHLRRFTRPTVLVMELLMAMGRMSPGWSFGTATTLAALRSWFDIGSRELAVRWLKDWVRSEPRVSSFENHTRMCLYVVPQGPGAEPVSAKKMAVWYSSNGNVVGAWFRLSGGGLLVLRCLGWLLWRVGEESSGNGGMEGIVSPGCGCKVFNLFVSCPFGMEGIAFFLRDLVAFEIDLVDIRSFWAWIALRSSSSRGSRMGWLALRCWRLKMGSFCSPSSRLSHWASMKRRKRCWTVVAHFFPFGCGAKMMELKRVRSFQPRGEFLAVREAIGNKAWRYLMVAYLGMQF